MKVFEIIPRYGLSDEEFSFNQKQAQYNYIPMISAEFDVTFNVDMEIVIPDLKNDSIFNLADNLCMMKECDVIVLGRGWENDRTCKLMMEVAEAYGYRIVNLDTNKI